MTLKQALYDLLAMGKLKEVFIEINKNAYTQSDAFRDMLILLQSRSNRNENNNNNGLVSESDYSKERNRIENAVISFIRDELDERRIPLVFKKEPIRTQIISDSLDNFSEVRNTIEPVKIFISFSKSDNEQRKELRQRLRYFELTDKTIIVWDDRDLYPGVKWNDEISKQMQIADIIICLMSKYYFGTDYILENELPLSIDLIKNDKTLIPIVLSKCNWHRTALGQLNALPEKGKPIEEYQDADDAWNEVVDKILDVVDRLRGKK